ncbi:hypothetical protein PCL_07023 [Purpureocillium lilacinum]|uniref:Uncharacterized protein n=1 Tax=Purpureocillium lilacinum TaxID=33203 RepID=A0A2U3DT50_PURLI|nr:hypothetical protein PCL_07023 [Purpureocillium lilacinum]
MDHPASIVFGREMALVVQWVGGDARVQYSTPRYHWKRLLERGAASERRTFEATSTGIIVHVPVVASFPSACWEPPSSWLWAHILARRRPGAAQALDPVRHTRRRQRSDPRPAMNGSGIGLSAAGDERTVHSEDLGLERSNWMLFRTGGRVDEMKGTLGRLASDGDSDHPESRLRSHGNWWRSYVGACCQERTVRTCHMKNPSCASGQSQE